MHGDLRGAHATIATLKEELKVAKDAAAKTRQHSDSPQAGPMEPNTEGFVSETPLSVCRCRPFRAKIKMDITVKTLTANVTLQGVSGASARCPANRE